MRWNFIHQLPHAFTHRNVTVVVGTSSSSSSSVTSRKTLAHWKTKPRMVLDEMPPPTRRRPRPTRNETKQTKRILPFSRTKPTHHRSFARTPSPVYLRTRNKARSPKLERRRRSNRTRRARVLTDPARRASTIDRRTKHRRRDYLERWRIFLRLRFKRRVRFFFHLALMMIRERQSLRARAVERGPRGSCRVTFRKCGRRFTIRENRHGWAKTENREGGVHH